MIPFRLFTVHRHQWPRFTRLQIHHPQIRIPLSYWEITTTASAVHQPATIIRGASKNIAHISSRSIKKRIYGTAEFPRYSIKRDSTKTAFYLHIFYRYVTSLGCTIIQCLSIWRKGRENFQPIRRRQALIQDQFVGFGIQQDDIAKLMEHFQWFIFTDEETLMDGISCISHITSLRMPISITTGSLGRICLRIIPYLSTVFLYKCTSPVTTDLRRELFRIGSIRRMTIEATTGNSIRCNQWGFIEIMDITLINTDMSPYFIPRWNTTISKTIISQLIFTDMNTKIT